MRSFSAKKSLGQNFLTESGVAERIVEAGEVGSADIVVEIGPGKGILTEKLIALSREVIAVEKDERLVMYLSFKFREAIEDGKLKIIAGDVLEFNPEQELLQAVGYKLIANIPYYITGKILRRFFSEVANPSLAVLMLQKEVAERIVAKNGKESILSLSIKAYGKPVYIETVGRDSFSPTPKVDSAVLLIKEISKKNFENPASEEKFFTLIKTGFASKRKTILNNLKKLDCYIDNNKWLNRAILARQPARLTRVGGKLARVSGERGTGVGVGKTETMAEIENQLRALKIDPGARAEDITLQKWLNLAKGLTRPY
ncbi:MAG: Ribosomal RNA small subunit methyltransferase A [Parcubacteria group bacterium GW2011_GWA2_47_21]|nr:MAG: Ribosomal RNA small subunit methyltransferase A [Parcubacteria group bacterium GW2011_GWA2_47_21]